MKAKKIILFIVEGITDKTCLGYVLDQLLSNHSIQFQLANGDITTQTGNNSSNIAARIGNLIKNFSGNIYKSTDFLEVVHLVDTDGTYISNDKIIQAEYEEPIYSDLNILTNNVHRIKQRNKQKSEVLNRLITLDKVYRTIPYSVYFFSCNLDHVLHNNSNLTRQEKCICADKFEKKYADKPTEFVDFLNNYQCPTYKNYMHTWEFIKSDTHSLQRYTNFHLFFSSPKNLREF